MAEPVMKKVKAGKITIQTATWKGRGETVLCVHGLTANCRSWDTIASALAPKYNVIALDLRGHGLSDKPKAGYSAIQHCTDIVGVIDSLKIDRINIMGHSLGALIALAFAADHPGRCGKAILMDGAGKLTKKQTEKVFAGIKPSLDRLGKIFPTYEAYTDVLKQAPFLNPWTKALDDYFRYETEKVKGGVRSRTHPNAIMQEIANLMQTNAALMYKRVKCPTLIIRAPEGMLKKDDILLPKNALKKMVGEIKQAWVAEMKGTNHYSIMFQKNRARDDVLKAFLES